MTDTTQHAAAAGAPAAQPAANDAPKRDERLGVITGVRVCGKCGFNLMGQLILREPTYGLIVARCPECGQVAPLQEYPSMGRTTRRWATLLGGLWVLTVLAGAAAASFALMGIMFGSLEIGCEDFARVLPGDYWSSTVDREAQVAFLRGMGGPIAAINPWVLGVWFGGAVLATITGVASSIVTLGLHGVRLLLMPLVVVIVPTVAFGIRRAVILGQISGGAASKSDIAEWLMGPHVGAATLLIFALMLMSGAMIGRPLARGLVCLLLPAPMRAGLAPLWLTDGKTLPKGRGW